MIEFMWLVGDKIIFYKVKKCYFISPIHSQIWEPFNACTQKWRNYNFKIPRKHLKGEKIHENILILQSLYEHASKNSVCLELYDF